MRFSFLLLFLAPLAHAQAAIDWAPEAESVTLSIPEVGWSMDFGLAEMDSVEVINLPLTMDGVRLSIEAIGSRDTLRLAPEASGVYRVRLVGLAQAAAFDFNFWPPIDVQFSGAFRQRHGGTSRILTPEVYELLNIGFALTPTGRDTTNAYVWRQGPYYADVMEHFAAFADQPFIGALETAMQNGDYVGVRMNGLAFQFDGEGLVPDSTYRSLGDGHDLLSAMRPLAEAFARESGFRAFYAAREMDYARQRQEVEALLPVRQMWDWLEAEFPERSQGYLTVFSPLTYGTHNAVELRDGDYRESAILLPGPDILDGGGAVVGKSTPAWREVEMTRMAFTEYDHTYVNPAMEPLAEEISEAMRDVSAWNRATGYQSPSETFAEYMTWGVFLLYVDAFYPADTAQEAREGTVQFMEEGRGFFRFGAFMEALTVLYDARAEGETLNDLMPAIVRWTAQQ